MNEIEACESLEQVRVNIDRIDNQLVELICEREKYVLQAAHFKKDGDAVRAPQRVEQIIAKVKRMAEAHNGDPGIVEKTYRTMIAAFIDAELKRHAADHA